MKKLRVIITSVIVLAIVGSAFAFNAKKTGRFCVTSDLTTTSCNTTITDFKRTAGINNRYYVPCWDGVACNSQNPITCTTSANFTMD